MDAGIQKLLEEWRLLDDQMRCAEAARGRWNTVRTALNGLLQADPTLFPEEVQIELGLPLNNTPRQDALREAIENRQLPEQATSIPEPPPTSHSKVQMWPLAKKILEEMGPLALADLHKELVAKGWKRYMDPRDRRVLYNTLKTMNDRFAKIDDKWTTKDNIFN